MSIKANAQINFVYPMASNEMLDNDVCNMGSEIGRKIENKKQPTMMSVITFAPANENKNKTMEHQ